MNALLRRSRCYCFTSFGFNQDDELKLQSADCHYLVYGRESCPTTLRRHLQGYICFYNAKSFKAVQNLLPTGSHISVARGTPSENRQYCTKENDYFEKGDLPPDTLPTAVEEARDIVKMSPTWSSAIDSLPIGVYLRHGKMLKELWTHFHTPKTEFRKKEVLWYSGPTGSGKTRSAYTEFPELWRAPYGLQWFDGYQGQDTVLFDDYRHDKCTPWGFLLQLLDGYPMQVPVKGSFVHFFPTRIIFTSPFEIESCFNNAGYFGSELEQLLRRITLKMKYPIFPIFSPVPLHDFDFLN